MKKDVEGVLPFLIKPRTVVELGSYINVHRAISAKIWASDPSVLGAANVLPVASIGLSFSKTLAS